MTELQPLDIESGEVTPTNVLNHAVGDLAAMRRKLDVATVEMGVRERQRDATGEHHAFINAHAAVKLMKSAVKTATEGIRELALEIAIELEQSKPVGGIEVVRKKSSIIADDEAALEYVKDRHPELLDFNANALIKILEATPEKARPDFFYTEVEEYGTVRISAKLDEIHPPGGTDDSPEDTPF